MSQKTAATPEPQVRHALYLPSEGAFADVGWLVTLAREAEEHGWDGVFIWDELLPIHEHSGAVRRTLGEAGHVADVFVALTAIAAVTERLRLGTMVAPLTRYRPEALAKLTATLDRYSGGRLILGVGLGYPPSQFTAFGGEGDPRTRAAMLDEFLEVLTLLWSGQVVDFHGEHYTATGVALLPTPLQVPRIPIWIGGGQTQPAPRRRAARWDGFAPASDSWPDDVIPPEDLEAMLVDIRSQRTTEAAFDLVVIGDADGRLLTPESLAAYERAGVTWALSQLLDVDDALNRIRRGPPGRG